MAKKRTPRVEIISPIHGASLSSPLAIVCVRYRKAAVATAKVEIGDVVQVVELEESTGEIRENVTLLTGNNTIKVTIGKSSHNISVKLAKSKKITINSPATRSKKGKMKKAAPKISTRATLFSGSYDGVSCPAGVIAVNGFMQQFAVPEAAGTFKEMVVLRPGANHLAVQIGEYYATKRVEGTFEPAKLLVTLVWDTDRTDLDLYVKEPSGKSVWFSNKGEVGHLDVDRTAGFGPENYSLGRAGGKVPPGEYTVRVHYFADNGVGRSEWITRVIADEGLPRQQRDTFYGILDRSAGNSGPTGKGPDWDEVCKIKVTKGGKVTIKPLT